MDVNVKVAVRCRPMSSKEISRGCQNIVEFNSPNSLVIKATEGATEDKPFTFDHVYAPDTTQQKVYQDLGRPIITQALDGFNGTIFAYGQTGSGKTFSMMGYDENKGIIPQLNDDLWGKLTEKMQQLEQKALEMYANEKERPKSKCFVTVSFLEVYNEDIRDLLNPSDKKLKIHESPNLGIYVEGLCELVVKDAADVIRLIYQGNAVRHVAATQMNDQSSRSHSVFTIKIEQKTVTALSDSRQREQLVKAKVNLVDLAGSERASKTNATGATLKEGANINKSLMTLGNVINQLAEGAGKKGKVIPYRESKLTRLLQESLGGNAATVMIASISPADYNYQETLSTLKYANRAKSIENAVVRNEDSSERMIRDLQAQIEQLKQQLAMNNAQIQQGSGPNVEKETPVVVIQQNEELEKKLKEVEQEQVNAWEEKERLSRQLEEEREKNMNSVLSQMMNNVKEQKVQHMKNIKRLTNEKALLTKNMKDWKEENNTLKLNLDNNIVEYQTLQLNFDQMEGNFAAEMHAYEEDLRTKGLSETEIQELIAQKQREHEGETEELANKMVPLLNKIEQDRLKYMEKRDLMARTKTRLTKIEAEITEERGELVATAGILSQNDKIREQIQEEERLKMQAEFQEMLGKEKEKLALQQQEVRDALQNEIQNELNTLQSELKLTKSLLKMEQNQNTELEGRFTALQEYSDQLESRLADSEVTQEASMEEIKGLQGRIVEYETRLDELQEENKFLSETLQEMKKELTMKMEVMQQEHIQQLHESKYELFAKMMDQFQIERQDLENKYKQTQMMLQQATKDIIHLANRNQELELALKEAILYEPRIV